MDSLLDQSCLRMAYYVFLKKYDALLSSGKSAPLTFGMLQRGWELADLPQERPREFDLGVEGNNLLYKEVLMKDYDSDDRILSFITEECPELHALKTRRVCYIDDHSDTGLKLPCLRDRLLFAGFTNVDFAIFFERSSTKNRRQEYSFAEANSYSQTSAFVAMQNTRAVELLKNGCTERKSLDYELRAEGTTLAPL